MGGPLGHTQYLWSPQTPPISGSVDSKPRPSFPFLQPRRVQTQCLHPAVPAGDPEQDRTLFPRLNSNSRPTGPVRPCQVRPGSPCQCLPRNASSQPRTRLHVPCTIFPAPPTTSPTRRVSARAPRFWALTCTHTGPDPAAAALQTSSQGSQAAAPALKGQALSPNKGGQLRALARPQCSSFYRHGELRPYWGDLLHTTRCSAPFPPDWLVEESRGEASPGMGVHDGLKSTVQPARRHPARVPA